MSGSCERQQSAGQPVTVVIPAFRAERTISRAVDSVLSQEGVDARVVVVIDGFVDGVCEILRQYGKNVRQLVNETNVGAAASRNRGLEIVDTEFVMFVDADDFIEGRLLAGLTDRMAAAEADIGFAPMESLVEHRDDRRACSAPDFGSPQDLMKSWLVEGRFVGTCSVLWRTRFLRKAGGWDEAIARNDDGEVVMRAIMLGARFTVSREGCGVYVQHHSAQRLTRRADNLDDLLRVGDKLLAMETGVISEDTKRELIGMHFYHVANACYSRAKYDLASEALARSRTLGFRGHGGPIWHRILCTFLGLRLRYRLTGVLKQMWHRPENHSSA